MDNRPSRASAVLSALWSSWYTEEMLLADATCEEEDVSGIVIDSNEGGRGGGGRNFGGVGDLHWIPIAHFAFDKSIDFLSIRYD
jgi:hypothetical protein